MSKYSELTAFLRTLVVTEGYGAGQPLRLMRWQSDFLRGALASGRQTAALSVPRGAGKTAMMGAVAAAAVAGPLAVSRGQVLMVASSFDQAAIAWQHAAAFLQPIREASGERWRYRRAQNAAWLENPANGAILMARGSDPQRLHGLAPTLVLADEPAQWPASVRDRMLAALETSLGKQPASRMVAIGTQSSDSAHWFQAWLAGGADYAKLYRAGDEDDWQDEAVWKAANPSLGRFKALERAYQREAAAAATNDSSLAAFRSLRLNMGVGDTVRAELLTAAAWKACEVPSVDMLPDMDGPCVWGVDLGSGAAMSAIAAYWPTTGRAEVIAAFPWQPDLLTRGKADSVSDLYQRMEARGELVQAGDRVVDVAELVSGALAIYGRPAAIVADRWRQAELRQALGRAGMPFCELVTRGMGFKDGGEDVRLFRRAALTGRLVTPVSLLMRYAMGGAVTVSDPAGNAKLAKAADSPLRRDGHRDDAVCALILAAAAGVRWRESAEGLPADAGYTVV